MEILVSRNRVTIGGLVALIAFAALGFNAMRVGSYPWYLATTVFTVVPLSVALMMMLPNPRTIRPFWFGMAVCGFGYAIASEAPPTRALLPTEWALDRLGRLRPGVTIDLTTASPEAKANLRQDDGSMRPGVVLGLSPTSGKLHATVGGPPEYFKQIGHLLTSLIVGLVGGLAALKISAVRGQARRVSGE
jgi:hypothetical protein